MHLIHLDCPIWLVRKVTRDIGNVALQQTTNYHFFQTGAILKLIQVAFSFMEHNVLKSRDTRLSSDLKVSMTTVYLV
jgi:hypothetical protein